MARFLGLVVILLLSACNGRVRSVRALRQHAREPARIAVVRARLADFQASLKALNNMLVGPGYVPGSLAQQLRLDESKARQLQAELEAAGVYSDESFRVPVAAIYRRHLEGLSQDAPAQTKSLLETADAMFGDGRTLKMAWDELSRARRIVATAERKVHALKAEYKATMRKASKHAKKEFQARIRGAEQLRDSREDEAERASIVLEKASGRLKLHTRTDTARLVVDDLVAVLSMGARLSAEVAALVPVVTTQMYSIINRTRLTCRRCLNWPLLCMSSMRS